MRSQTEQLDAAIRESVLAGAALSAEELAAFRENVLDAQARLGALLAGFAMVLDRAWAAGDLQPWRDVAMPLIDCPRIEVGVTSQGHVDAAWLSKQVGAAKADVDALAGQLLFQIDMRKAVVGE